MTYIIIFLPNLLIKIKIIINQIISKDLEVGNYLKSNSKINLQIILVKFIIKILGIKIFKIGIFIMKHNNIYQEVNIYTRM